jgi:hypothetical protein
MCEVGGRSTYNQSHFPRIEQLQLFGVVLSVIKGQCFCGEVFEGLALQNHSEKISPEPIFKKRIYKH